MEKKDILTTFNNHIIEFFNDILLIFPEDNDLKVSQVSLMAIRKANPKLIISIWNKYISSQYTSEIESGNLEFFINKNYTDDLKDTENSSTILSKIDTLREPIKQLSSENMKKTIQYMQNLSKLCNIYYQ
tara:strand:+ start:300 stop:689 length:390 start_codon:yes stop_codon:yes gene_type:complete